MLCLCAILYNFSLSQMDQKRIISHVQQLRDQQRCSFARFLLLLMLVPRVVHLECLSCDVVCDVYV